MLSSGSQGWAGLKFVPQTRGNWPCDLCSTPTPVGGGGETGGVHRDYCSSPGPAGGRVGHQGAGEAAGGLIVFVDNSLSL